MFMNKELFISTHKMHTYCIWNAFKAQHKRITQVTRVNLFANGTPLLGSSKAMMHMQHMHNVQSATQRNSTHSFLYVHTFLCICAQRRRQYMH